MAFSFVDMNGRRYGRDREPDECPLCHFAIDPQEVTWAPAAPYWKGLFVLEIVYRCPRSVCGRFFIARYKQIAGMEMPGEHYLRLFETVPSSPPLPQIAGEVTSISPLFAEIYGQAMAAESYGLHQIAGVGYRKALEYLIKDYCISIHADREQDIKSEWLGKCINNFVDSTEIKQCAERAAWLGNDETHYIRKWPDKDIRDLKKLITLTVNWIHNTVLTQDYLTDMKDGKG